MNAISNKGKRKLFRGLLLLGTMGLLVIILSSYLHYVQNIEQTRVDQTVRESAIQSVALIQERMKNDMTYIEDIGHYLGQQKEPITSTVLLQAIQTQNNAKKTFKTITTATPEGDLYNTAGQVIGNIANRTYFKKAMAGQTVISNIEKSPDDNENIISVAAPIARDGRIIGIVNGRFLMSELVGYLSANVFDGRGYSYMASADGNIFVWGDHPEADPDFTNIYEKFKPNVTVSDDTLAAMLQTMKTGGEGRLSYDWHGEKRTMSYLPVGINDWYLLSVLPNDIVASRAMEFSKQVLILTLLLLFILLVLIYGMRSQRRQNQKALAAIHLDLLTLYNTIPGGIFKCLLDEEFTVIEANDGFYRFFGCTRESFQQENHNQLTHLSSTMNMSKIKESLTAQLQKGSAICNEIRLTDAAGNCKWMLLNGEAVQVAGGQDLLYCSFTDISELKQTQAELNLAHQESTRLYNLVASGIFCSQWDIAYTLIDANPGFYRLIGYTKEAFAEQYHNEFSRIIFPEDLPALRDDSLKQQELSNPILNEYRIYCGDGTTKWLWGTADLVEEAGKRSVYCAVMDITSLKESQEKLRLSQQRYELIMAETQSIIFEWNPLDKTIYHSKTYQKKLGCEPIVANFPQSVLDGKIVLAEDEETFLDIYRRLEQGANFSAGEIRIKQGNGNFLWCRISTTAIRDKNNTLCRVIGMIVDIDHAKRELQQVKELAQRDPLTALYNKTTTEHLIQERLETTATAALLVLDIDDFKTINDTLGHNSGDRTLTELAHCLKSLFRANDIVGRVGGDEFVVFLAGFAERPDLMEKLTNVITVFQDCCKKKRFDCCKPGQIEPLISCSIGVSLYPKDGQTFEELFQKADEALYFAKRHGKNRFALYDTMETTDTTDTMETMNTGNTMDTGNDPHTDQASSPR